MLFISCLWERQAHILLGWQGGGGGPRDSRVHLHVSPFPWGISALQRVWLAGLLWECPLLRHVTHPSHDQLSLCPLGTTPLPPPAVIPCLTPVSGHITPTPHLQTSLAYTTLPISLITFAVCLCCPCRPQPLGLGNSGLPFTSLWLCVCCFFAWRGFPPGQTSIHQDPAQRQHRLGGFI